MWRTKEPWILLVVIVFIIGAGYVMFRPSRGPQHVPVIHQVDPIIINGALMVMAEENHILRQNLAKSPVEQDRVAEYRKSLRQQIIVRYGDMSYRFVLASNGHQKLVLDFPSMQYRLERY